MHNRRRESGQALCEFALTLPILMALVLGVIELGYALFQTQLVTSMAREGSNLIARQVTINDAEAALQTMSGLVSFDANSTLILSVVRLGVGGANNNVPIIVQRHSVGAFAASSVRTAVSCGSLTSSTAGSVATGFSAKTCLPFSMATHSSVQSQPAGARDCHPSGIWRVGTFPMPRLPS